MTFLKIFVLIALGSVDALSKKLPTAEALRRREAKRVAEKQHEINENIRKFKETLESLRTTVDFEPTTI
jgi:hypothetical protein